MHTEDWIEGIIAIVIGCAAMVFLMTVGFNLYFKTKEKFWKRWGKEIKREEFKNG